MRPLVLYRPQYTPECIDYILKKGYAVLDSQNVHIKTYNINSLSKNMAAIALFYTLYNEMYKYSQEGI